MGKSFFHTKKIRLAQVYLVRTTFFQNVFLVVLCISLSNSSLVTIVARRKKRRDANIAPESAGSRAEANKHTSVCQFSFWRGRKKRKNVSKAQFQRVFFRTSSSSFVSPLPFLPPHMTMTDLMHINECGKERALRRGLREGGEGGVERNLEWGKGRVGEREIHE